MSLQTTEQLLTTSMMKMGTVSPPVIAQKVGVSTSGKTVRKVIKAARESLARQAERYVEAHGELVEACLANGDAKSLGVAAKATEWALERIADGETRIIDKPSTAPNQPSLQIGIAIGGIPQQTAVSEAPEDIEDAEVLELPPAPDGIDPELMP